MESITRRVLQGSPLGAVFLNTLVNDLEMMDNKGLTKPADDKE